MGRVPKEQTDVKVYIFWESQKILQNLPCRFDRYYIRQIYGGDFAKSCGLLRIFELYALWIRSKGLSLEFISMF